MNIVFGDYKLPYVKSSYTSKMAAIRQEPRAGTQRAILLDHFKLRDSYGATDEEQQDRFQMNPSTPRPRRVELVNQGWIKDSGRTRATRSGAQAVVWVLSEPPIQAIDKQS